MEIQLIRLDDLKEDANVKLMEDPVASRMVVISGEFPFRLQVEEFRRALRFPSVAAMLADPDVAIEFVGFEVERREVGGDGKAGAWQPLDIVAEMKRVLQKAVEREKENDELLAAYPIRVKGLLMTRPVLAKDQKYPDPELPGIRDTLDAIKQGKVTAPPPPQKSRFEADPDVFSDTTEDADKEKGKGKNPMNAALAPAGEGVSGRGAGNQANQLENRELTLPEKAPVRFIDPTVQPDKAYEYRVRIKMTNPAYGKKDKAVAESITKDQFLLGPWKEVGQRVTLPPRLLYYAYDDTLNENGRMEKMRGVLPADNNRVAVQLHRWIDTMQPPSGPKGDPWQIGDWSVVERLLVYRGEFIGTLERVELPVWAPTKETFQFATASPDKPQPRSRTRLPTGVPVDFNTECVLVDFEGGGGVRPHSVGSKTILDQAPAELLVQTPDGRVVVARNAKADTDDPKRKERLEGWMRSQEAIRNKAEGGGDKKPGDNLFDKKPGG